MDARDANQRLERRADTATWAGIAVATVLHFLVFAFSPTWTAEVRAGVVEPPEVLVIDEVPLPEQPADIPRPAFPNPSLDAPDDLTLAPQPDWNAVPDMPPPPETREEGAGGALPWVPHTISPRLENAEEVAERLERAYPSHLRDAGIGGTVTLHVHIDVRGGVLEARVGASSGSETLDRAALAVAEAFRFSPAYNRDRAVSVWIALPVQFRAR